MSKIKKILNDYHFQSAVIAIVFVALILLGLFLLSKINISYFDATIIGGVIIGILCILFPKSIHRYLNIVSEKNYNNKEKKKIVFGGIIIVIFSLAFYALNNYI